jgi:N6-L-threonylcarbamoyladenine synthase
MQGKLTLEEKQEIAFEFQSAVNEVLAYKILQAAKEKNAKTILLAGGVSANDDLREKISTQAEKLKIPFLFPTKKVYCMDNAAMIGILAYYRVKYGKFEEYRGTVQVGKS